MPKPKSKKQARLFGAVAAGKATKAKGMSPAEARERLRGAKVKSLPMRKKKKRKRS
jgi:hypothetical protein